jgi:hypothetical protein
MLRTKPAVAVLCIAVFTSSAAAQRSNPAATVTAFYEFDRAHDQAFNQSNMNTRKRWFSDTLNVLFENELKRQKEYLKQNPTDKPHFGDGVPFQPLQEQCKGEGRVVYLRKYRVGRANLRSYAATVPVTFYYPKACNIPDTEFTVRLIKVKNTWYVNDVEFPDGSTLIADLQRAKY